MDSDKRRERLLYATITVAAVAVAFLVHHSTYHPSWTDENLHLYVASRVAEGAGLYGDIRSARPPLVIWTPAPRCAW